MDALPTAMEHNATTSLLSLPRELRDLIWDTVSTPTKPNGELPVFTLERLRVGRMLLIRPRRVCKEMYDELKGLTTLNTPVKLVVEETFTRHEGERHKHRHLVEGQNSVKWSNPATSEFCGCYLICELPKPSVRCVLRMLHTEVIVPLSKTHHTESYDQGTESWLDFLHDLKKLGFTQLQTLTLDLTAAADGARVGLCRSGETTEDCRERLQDWVRKRVTEIEETAGPLANVVEVTGPKLADLETRQPTGRAPAC